MGVHTRSIAVAARGASGVVEPHQRPGFRHFLGDPGDGQRFRVYERDPDASPENLERMRGLMCRLSRRMDADIEWPAHERATCRSWENPNIPSGYTYLAQFVAHDLVQSSTPLSLANDMRGTTLNMRRSGLKLDTLYGAGPVSCPFAYALDDGADRSRTKLRLGRIQRDDRTTDAKCPFRDIPRAAAENQTGIDRGIPGRLALTDALLVDPRNDDHAILSQMTTLFALLHNGLVDLVTRAEGPRRNSVSQELAHRRYLCARGATTLIYRNVVRHDLMRRLLHPEVYRAYAPEHAAFIDEVLQGPSGMRLDEALRQQEWRVPLEFSHGAFRFGHALVRNQYRINDIATNELAENLEKTSLTDPINMPLNESWIVQWSQFFEITGIEDSETILSQPGGSYPIPDFYKRIFNGMDPVVPENERMRLHAERIGDYTISLCM